MDTIRSRFRHVRKLRGLTQDAVGELLGVKAGTVYRWESGAIELLLPTLEAAAELLQCSRVWLVFGEGEPPQALLASPPPPPNVEDDEPCEGAA